jgi:hypothetical protein
MDSMEVCGALHASSDLDPRRFIATITESFLPLTKAVVTLCTNDRCIVEQETTMVNVHQIRCIA